MEGLSPTAKVILGLLSIGPRSGYDIKRMVDRSTRFFWAASYGQIYPELKRLTNAGLIQPEDTEKGGRRRTTYRVTEAGRLALEDWIRTPGLVHELRDEGLLKVFFAGHVGREELRHALLEARATYEEKRMQLGLIEEYAAGAERFGPHAVLRFGLGYAEFAIRWCDQTLKELEEEDE